MQFEEYLNILYAHIGGDLPKHEFFQTLVEHSIENPDDNPLSELSPNTINKYFSSTNKDRISIKNAKKLLQLIQLPKLCSYISEQSTIDSLDRLEENLVKYRLYSDTHKKDVVEIYAGLFIYFLEERVGIQTSSKENITVSDIPITKVHFEDGKIVIGSQSFQLPGKEPIPDSLIDLEEVYSKQLLMAYSENDGNPKTDYYDFQNLPKKYRNHLHDQRINFFNADYVLRAIRDGFKDSEQQIALLKQETYDSISDYLFEDYTTSLKKVTETLKHITTVSLSKPEITQIQNFIGNSEKKGLCHTLVNDGKFNWVDDNE